MIKDPIVEEIHKIRDEYAKRFNYDLGKIYEDIRQKQEKDKAAGKEYVSRPPKRPKQAA